MQRPGMSHRGNRAALFGDRRPAAAPAGGRTVYDDETAKAMEVGNNQSTNELAEKVAALKQISQGLHSEVRHQNQLLAGMSDDMDSTNNLLSSSLEQLQKLLTTGGSMHMCHLVLFACAVFFMLYWLFMRK